MQRWVHQVCARTAHTIKGRLERSRLERQAYELRSDLEPTGPLPLPADAYKDTDEPCGANEEAHRVDRTLAALAKHGIA